MIIQDDEYLEIMYVYRTTLYYKLYLMAARLGDFNLLVGFLYRSRTTQPVKIRLKKLFAELPPDWPPLEVLEVADFQHLHDPLTKNQS